MSSLPKLSTFLEVSAVETSAPIKMTGVSPLLQFSAIPAALLLGFFLFGGLNEGSLIVAMITAIPLMIAIFQPRVADDEFALRDCKRLAEITDWGALYDSGDHSFGFGDDSFFYHGEPINKLLGYKEEFSRED